MDDQYRYGVIGVFQDANNRVLVCERSNLPGSWQFPQGGIDEGEDPHTAVMREMFEELGTEGFEVVRAVDGLTTYDFPPDAKFPLAKKFRGQKHYWFLMRFKQGFMPDLTKSDGEFQKFEWRDACSCLHDVVAWKKEAYEEGLKLLGLAKG